MRHEAIERQLQKGEFIEALFDCPYELHELVTEPYIALLLYDLPEKDKELLYQCAVRQYSSVKIAAIRGQSDRNVRKVRATMLKRILQGICHRQIPCMLRQEKTAPISQQR